jgi:hypothetical protein
MRIKQAPDLSYSDISSPAVRTLPLADARGSDTLSAHRRRDRKGAEERIYRHKGLYPGMDLKYY